MSATQTTTTTANERRHVKSALPTTPWGRADSVTSYGEEGIYFASTPSHGGFYVPDELLHHIPAAHRTRARYWSGSPNWYEEDCEAASVISAFPELFTPEMIPGAEATLRWRNDREATEKGAR